MKREILFQGKRIDDERWIEGFYVQHWMKKCCVQAQEFKDQFLKHFIMHDGNVFVRGGEPPWVATEVDPKTVRQYTGYRDLNCDRIFEGDILHVNHDDTDGYSLVVVAFIHDQWKALTYSSIDYMMEHGWSDKASFIDHMPLDDLCIFHDRCDCYIAGNIYDLPVPKTPEIRKEDDA